MAVYFPFFFIPLRVSSAAVNRVHPTGQQAFDRRSSLAGLLAVAVGGTRVIGPWQTPPPRVHLLSPGRAVILLTH